MTEWVERVRGELASRYRIERELGRGSTATVYLADDLTQQRQVAVKVLHPELVQAVGGQRFLREIRVAASLHHPHLLAIHDSGEANGLFYFVAPYLPDGSLRTLLNRERQLSVDEALRITREIADALGYVHEHGIVHRDVKPENILFAGTHACVADFGIARAIDIAVGDTLTSTGLVVGTPAYMSPEQASGERAVDARSDQYSLACVLYEMLGGVPPFVGATAQSVISQRFAHAPSPLTFYRPNVQAGIEAAIARALSIAPADRFASVGDFVTALDRRAPAVVRIDPAVRLRKLQRRWFIAGATAALVVIALFGFSQARERVLASRRAAIDTSRFVVLPFVDAAGASISGARATEAVQAALSQWRDLEVVPTLSVRDRVDEQGTRIASLDDALDLARDLGAGRAVWGRIGVRESGLRLALYDVVTGRPLREVGSSPLAGDTAELAIGSMTNRLLRGTHFTAGAESGELGTRRLSARRAYERGHKAFERGEFATAFREFAGAAAIDNAYAHAQLWTAITGLFLGTSSDWQQAARRAAAVRSTFDSRESALANAVAAMAEEKYVDACAHFDDARRLAPLDFIAWYGAGECRHRDSAIVPSRKSPSGWMFRSSYRTAIGAYLRAVQLDPRVYKLPVHDRLHHMLGTQMGIVRQGHDLTRRHAAFAAYPEIVNDTLAFVPYPIIGNALTAPQSRWRASARAAARNAELVLEFARGWAKHEPQSAHALDAVAAALEAQGELSESVDRSALIFVRRARALRVTSYTALELGTREVRLLLKIGRFGAARALADSLLGFWPQPNAQAAHLLDGLAALTGKVRTLTRLTAMLHDEEIAGVRLPSPVREKAAALDARAALGICDQIDTLYAKLLSDVDTYVSTEDAAAVKSELVADAAMWATPCTGALTGLAVASSKSELLRAQRAFAVGRRAQARALLDTITVLRRDVSPAGVSLDHAFQRAWLRAALGDTAGAIRQLDLSLGGLAAQRPALVTRPAEAAGLPRAMALRAELAAAGRDFPSARGWARAALELWGNADPELKGFVDRLRWIARQ